jgi:hypothetical protein
LDGAAEVLSEQTSGSAAAMDRHGWTVEIEQQIEQHPGVLSVHSRSATLDELFAACARPRPAVVSEHEKLYFEASTA